MSLPTHAASSSTVIPPQVVEAVNASYDPPSPSAASAASRPVMEAAVSQSAKERAIVKLFPTLRVTARRNAVGEDMFTKIAKLLYRPMSASADNEGSRQLAMHCFRQCTQFYVPTENEDSHGLLFVHTKPTPFGNETNSLRLTFYVNRFDGLGLRSLALAPSRSDRIAIIRSDGRGHVIERSNPKIAGAMWSVLTRIAYALGMRPDNAPGDDVEKKEANADEEAKDQVGMLPRITRTPLLVRNTMFTIRPFAFQGARLHQAIAAPVSVEGRALIERAKAIVAAHFPTDTPDESPSLSEQ